MAGSDTIKTPVSSDEPVSSDGIVQTLLASFRSAKQDTSPYTYWTADDLLPEAVAREIRELPFEAPELGGVSGKREKHNATRTYFDAPNRAEYGVVEATARAFQSGAVIGEIETLFGTSLSGTYLRMEYAQDIDGFWLEPHSDLGVKMFTLLLYLSTDAPHVNLGTDIYDANKQQVGSMPFIPNRAMIFVPGDNTFHGFERRNIPGVRKSLIVNYVTDEWRAREQLAFPDAPIGR